MTRISIALATYNGARFVREQLQTLAEQTLAPFELVVSDDGSTDDTLSIVRAFAKHAPFPVRVLESEGRLGYQRNFRRAAQACKGDLIAFCDQDDLWHPGKLERMERCFADPEVLLAYHNANVFDGTHTRPLYFAAVEHATLAIDPLPPFKTINGLVQVFRADLRRYDHLWDFSIDQHHGNVILAHDQWYFFLALLLGRIEFVDEALLDYRQHGENTIGVKAHQSLVSRLHLFLLHYGYQDLASALSAESRVKIVTAIERTESVASTKAVIDHYKVFADRLRRRAATYSDRTIFARLYSLAKSIVCGDYGGGPWRFKHASIVRDLWSGVIRNQDHLESK